MRWTPAKHPLAWTFLCFLVLDAPQVFTSIWQLFRTDAPIPVFRDWLKEQNLSMFSFSPFWISVPLGLVMFLWLIVELRLQRGQLQNLEMQNAPLYPGGNGDIKLHIATEEPFDISQWANHASYFVWVAACLWIEMKPAPRIDQDHPAYPMLQKIKGALDSGQIESLTGSANMNAKVLREELIKLASIHREKPRFLFPSEAPSTFEEEFSAAFKRTLFKDKKDDRKAVLLRLTELRDDGVIVRNTPGFLTTPEEMNRWFLRADEWTDDLLDALENLDAADAKWLATLDTLPPARVAIPNVRTGEKSRFELAFRSLDCRLARLNDLLKKYGVGA